MHNLGFDIVYNVSLYVCNGLWIGMTVPIFQSCLPLNILKNPSHSYSTMAAPFRLYSGIRHYIQYISLLLQRFVDLCSRSNLPAMPSHYTEKLVTLSLNNLCIVLSINQDLLLCMVYLNIPPTVLWLVQPFKFARHALPLQILKNSSHSHSMICALFCL